MEIIEFGHILYIAIAMPFPWLQQIIEVLGLSMTYVSGEIVVKLRDAMNCVSGAFCGLGPKKQLPFDALSGQALGAPARAIRDDIKERIGWNGES